MRRELDAPYLESVGLRVQHITLTLCNGLGPGRGLRASCPSIRACEITKLCQLTDLWETAVTLIPDNVPQPIVYKVDGY